MEGKPDSTTAGNSFDDAEDLKLPRWTYGRAKNGDGPNFKTGYLLKRPSDIVVGLIGIVIALPLWIIFAIAIKLEDRGPFLFTQERWGKDKTRILVYKVRTMAPNATETFGNVQAQENDPRITKVGKLLRATSLDESPQLINILKGDMSWVGPRALPINEVQAKEDDGSFPDEAIEGFEARSKLRPGLTGIAQVFAPRDIPREQKYRYDAVYAGSQSSLTDIRLVLASLWITFRAKWESREGKL